MAGTQKLARKSLAVQVADALREMILSGEFEQGEQLRQDDIAQRLGVSRIPLREAYQQLEAEGLVVNVPYKGAIVSRLSTDEITEYFDIRATLEAELLSAAIDHMDEDVIAKARDLAEQMNISNPTKRGELNWQMHEVLYRAANRPITLEMVKKIHDNLDRYVRIQLSLSEGNRERADKEHERLITCCEQRRKDDAIQALKVHINGARDDLVAYLRDHDK